MSSSAPLTSNHQENDGHPNGHTIPVVSFQMRIVPIHANKHLRIICIGAGASGICMAYKLKHSFADFTLDIFEKNFSQSELNPNIDMAYYIREKDNGEPLCRSLQSSYNAKSAAQPLKSVVEVGA